jgi:hypothetical protein
MQTVTVAQVLAWRMRRQFLDPTAPARDAMEVADRLCGVQAQVSSAAELAIGVRTGRPAAAEVDRALRTDRTLVKLWAARGTLHLLTPRAAALQCAVLGQLRLWQRASWLRGFGVTRGEMDALLAGCEELLTGRVLSREQLVEELVDRIGSAHLTEALKSGWGALLKPAAFAGLLCHGPQDGNRVTFTSPASWLPQWRPVDPDAAGPLLVRAYLSAYGPATRDDFAQWLYRGVRRSQATGWFADLGDGLVNVEVDGVPASILADDLDELLDCPPATGVRLLGAFDQYVIAVSRTIIPAEHLAKVSRTAGWISPVALHAGRIAGVWRLEGDRLLVEPFEDLPKPELAAEASGIGRLLGVEARLAEA